MLKIKAAAFGCVLATSAIGLSAIPAGAAGPAAGIGSLATPSTGLIEPVQMRRGGARGPTLPRVRTNRSYRGGSHVRGGRHVRGSRTWRGRGYYGRRGGRGWTRPYYRRGHGLGAALAVGAVGATIAAIIANSGYSEADYHAACDRKYKTYDLRTGTFMGYDGKRHYCRL
ncbi:MAG: BA14K family protein [Hyphomicrobiales bacterium]|nr:BA14K family protein [Hyphomicrobiales bacterium]